MLKILISLAFTSARLVFYQLLCNLDAFRVTFPKGVEEA